MVPCSPWYCNLLRYRYIDLVYADVAYRVKRSVYRAVPGLQSVLGFNRTFRDRWVRRQVESLPKGGKVLDIGAGSCPYRDLFSDFEYLSHDFAQLDDRQLEGRQGYGRIDIVSSIESIPLPDASVDVIICTEVLEHVPQPILAVAEFSRLLKPGGVLLVTAPQRSGLHQVPYHFYGGYTPYWYELHLSEYGFTDIEIEAVGGLFMAFAEEGQRVVLYSLFPNHPLPAMSRVVLFLVGLLLAPWLLLIIPCLSLLLQKLFAADEYRLGNCVRAKRVSSSEA